MPKGLPRSLGRAADRDSQHVLRGPLLESDAVVSLTDTVTANLGTLGRTTQARDLVFCNWIKNDGTYHSLTFLMRGGQERASHYTLDGVNWTLEENTSGELEITPSGLTGSPHAIRGVLVVRI